MKSIYFKCNSNCKHMYFKSIIWIPKTICTLSIFPKPIPIKSWERTNVIFHNFSCFKCLYKIPFICQIPLWKTFIWNAYITEHSYNRLLKTFTYSIAFIHFSCHLHIAQFLAFILVLQPIPYTLPLHFINSISISHANSHIIWHISVIFPSFNIYYNFTIYTYSPMPHIVHIWLAYT